MHPCERYKLEAHTPPLNDVRSLLYSLASSSKNSKSDEKGLLYSSSSLQRYRTTVYSTVRDGDHHQFITSLGLDKSISRDHTHVNLVDSQVMVQLYDYYLTPEKPAKN